MRSPVGSIPLDRTSPVPLYFQIAQYLERAIESGELPPGAQLENEVQLAGQLGLSRPTMRRAMQYLVDRGLLVRKRGIGTQVVRAKVKRPVELSSLWDDLASSGQTPATTVLANIAEPASGEVAQQLGLAEGTPVTVLDRLRFARGEPLARLRNYLPRRLVPGLTDRGAAAARPVPAAARPAASRCTRRRRPSAPARPPWPRPGCSDEAGGAPLLTMERITYDDQGRVVEYGTHIYRASRYSFELALWPADRPGPAPARSDTSGSARSRAV